MSEPRVVIVGAGAAGPSVAETRRRQGFTGPVTLIGDEATAPYDRPPLSKQYLAGRWDARQLELRSPQVIASLNLDLRLGVSARAVDPAARRRRPIAV